MEYPIEKNVPAPTPVEETQTKYAHLKVKADLMEVGDSIWVPNKYAADALVKYLKNSKDHLYEYKKDQFGRYYQECLYLRKKEPREDFPYGTRVWYLDKNYVLESNFGLGRKKRNKIGFSDKENRAYYLRVHNLN